jgi:hypothetical protein
VRKLERRRHRGVCVLDPQRGPCRERALRRLLEVVGVTPEDHGLAERARLDQVLAAVLEEAATHQHQVRRAIVGEHLAHGVADNYACARRHGGSAAAPRGLEAARARELRDLVEALRMARNDHEKGLRRHRGEGVEQQRLFALARAAGDPDRTLRAQERAQLGGPGRDPRGHLQVEFHVARDGHVERAERDEAACIGVGLRGDAGEVR